MYSNLTRRPPACANEKSPLFYFDEHDYSSVDFLSSLATRRFLCINRFILVCCCRYCRNVYLIISVFLILKTVTFIEQIAYAERITDRLSICISNNDHDTNNSIRIDWHSTYYSVRTYPVLRSSLHRHFGIASSL